MISFFFFSFFFSSRRRHTRSTRDWSSDVCSSDLAFGAQPRSVIALVCLERLARREAVERIGRSEERRVGKECRSRWWRDHEKKKKKRIEEEREEEIHRERTMQTRD